MLPTGKYGGLGRSWGDIAEVGSWAGGYFSVPRRHEGLNSTPDWGGAFGEFIPSFIHSTPSESLHVIPDIVLSAGDRVVNKMGQTSATGELKF